MDFQTKVNLALTIVSSFLAFISVVTVIITIRQNHKMIESATRPYISIYGESINPGSPMFYIVSGYRDSMINHVWFFERLNLTVYFWVITGIFFVVGAFVFKRLKVHFADTL